jgi:FkbM family methyltransferase
MKLKIKRILQSLLGLENYLFWFSIIKIKTLQWDQHEGDFMHFLPYIPEDAVVLDIGANIGIMAVLLAKKCHLGTVHAFEPMPVNFKTLKRVIKWFHLTNVIIHPIALGNENQVVEMLMPVVDRVRLQGISHVITADQTTPESGDRASVECRRLDDMDQYFAPGVKIGAIKLDVEGFEYFVFDGGQKLLEFHRPAIYCEITENAHYQKCMSLLDTLRYDIKLLIQDQLVDFNVAVHRKNGNFFLIPRP